MSRRSPNHLLAALLAEADWSGADLARAVNALGAGRGIVLHYDRTTVAHWLTGSRPRFPVPELVSQALSDSTGRLIIAADTGLALPGITPGILPAPALESAPVDRLIILCRAETDLLLRPSLARTAYSLTAIALPIWPGRPGRSRTATFGRAGPPDVLILADMVQMFATMAERHGGMHARLALAVYLAEDVTPLLAASATESVHRQLLTEAARLTYLLAGMTLDSGYHGMAQRYYHTACSLAVEAGDRATYAIILRAMSVQALQLGHHQRALALAEAAVTTAGSAAPPATRTFLLIGRSVARASTRLCQPALQDLDDAQHHHGASAAGPPGPFTTYTRASLGYQTAEVLLALGDYPGAVAALQSSLLHRPAEQRRSRVLTHARLAGTLLRIGHLDAACTQWRFFLDHYPHLKSAQARQALTLLRQGLRPHQRHPRAAALLQYAHTLEAPVRRHPVIVDTLLIGP